MIGSIHPHQQAENLLFSAHPAMFRSNPIAFLLCILIIPVFGLGLAMLLFWWLDTLGTTLSITDKRTILRKGLLSNFTTEVFHQDIRNVLLRQTFFQRLFGVGYIGISSAGQAGIEIEVDGIRKPNFIKDLLYKARQGTLSSLSPTVPKSESIAPPSHGAIKIEQNAIISQPIHLDDDVEEKESALALMLRQYGQRVLDTLAYSASFSWVSRMPDWAQPIVWGLLVSLPIVFLLIIAFNRFK
jgi:hypothetical protein